MGVLIYTLALIFFIIPVSLRAYLSLKKGRFPLPVFQNNVVVNRIKLRKGIGILSPIVFWVFHVFFMFWAIAIEAWLSALAVVVYMVISPLLSGQIKAKQVSVIQEKVAPEVSDESQA
ncbi:hypothetical protein [Pseudoxanthomonas wuyuanensis]|uniref:Uncharacterized protein n=1 Tax=Pseudoxanthomonas wuyuanensis TaxID=1073196 RepID=A0A286D840_9GAMM|nr:hypothetical protein [Pseudoxanthomonas wuyuanensis]KAF1720159.1 hypothetical protein CSC75_12455 [Pseudoxanthomonas wuyuanensis]SOD54777.1 hypothetical protein SAMN06296416_10537 [Pseudoxanthomonas wuyuanensis]